MIVIIWKPLQRIIGCDGIVLYPFIIFSKKDYAENERIMNHERIHVRQALEMLIIPFYIVYLAEFLFRRCSTTSKYDAYRAISFEKEAYGNDHDLTYLNKRRPFGFTKYLNSPQ